MGYRSILANGLFRQLTIAFTHFMLQNCFNFEDLDLAGMVTLVLIDEPGAVNNYLCFSTV